MLRDLYLDDSPPSCRQEASFARRSLEKGECTLRKRLIIRHNLIQNTSEILF